MKKTAGLILKISIGIILLILVLLFTVPLIFKDKIKIKVEQTIAGSVNAKVRFEDYHLGFFRNFPNLSFSLSGLSVTGVNKFENDTLAAFKSLDLVFDLLSLFKKSGYEIKSIIIDKGLLNTIVLKDGSANWDIMKDTSETRASTKQEGSSGLKILLKKVSLVNSTITYKDFESDIQAYLREINCSMKGDMTASETDLQISGSIGDFTYGMEGIKYLNKAVVNSQIVMLANLDSMKFTFRDNYLTINDLNLNFSGTVGMPGNDISTDLSFKTTRTSFSSLLSMIPAVYMKDYKSLKTTGEFSLSGTVKGIYSDADSTMPDIASKLSVTDGSVSYPSLPEEIKNIDIRSDIFVDGRKMDRSSVDIDQFHMELAGSPFDMKFRLKTPVSDPDFNGSMSGHLDLSALSKAIPMDSITLSGIIDISVAMAGQMSGIEKKQYENFKASGNMGIRNMLVDISGYPEVKINEAGFEFTPAYAILKKANINVGTKSDFDLAGSLTNYIPYLLKGQTIKGNFSMRSKLIDASDIMSKIKTDTAVVADTAALTLIKIPMNIDFDFDAIVDELRYGSIQGQNLKGHIIVRDGILSMRETGMNLLGGMLTMNADYDTRDTLKPVMKADMDLQNIAVKDAFSTFNTVRKLTPAAKGLDGKVNLKIGFQSLLGSDMMPVIKSISGEGKLRSDEITLVESGTFDQMKSLLKLGNNYSNTLHDVNVSFKVDNGRIYVSPFDIRTGNLKMNISGDQGLDQTLNYLVKTEMPNLIWAVQ